MGVNIEKFIVSLKLSETLVNEECNILTNTIDIAKEVCDIVASERKKIEANNINVIDAAARGNLRETGHSRILYNLLKNRNIRKSFYKRFLAPDITDTLRTLELDNNITKNIDREKGHIDVSIYAKPYFIIIENKVKGAVEQPGQIYRYVQYGKEKTELKKIYVLYLNKDTYERPTFYSLNKEGLEDGESAFPEDMIDEHIIPLSYKNDIYEWIKDIYKTEKENNGNNEILISALVQYKDYLENIFELTDKYKPMKEEINKRLEEILSLNNESLSGQIDILGNQIENVEKLKERLEALRTSKFQLKIKELHQEFNKRFSDDRIELINIPSFEDNEPMFGFEFYYKGEKMYCCASKENNKCWYGIRYLKKDNYKTDYISEIKGLNLITNLSSNDEYPIWKYTSTKIYDTNNLLDKTCELAQKIIAKTKDPNSGFTLT